VLLALGLWILACPAQTADENDLEALNQEVAKLFEAGKYQDAIVLAERALEIVTRERGPEDRDTATLLDSLAILYQAIGDYAKAEPLFRQALRIRQKVLGKEDPDTAASLNDLGALYQAMGDYAKAKPLFEQALRIRQKVLGKEHPDTAVTLNNLGALYQAKGDYVAAEPYLVEALRIIQKVLGMENPYTATALNNLASLYVYMEKYAKAEPLLIEALRIRKKVLGDEHLGTAASLNDLAGLYKAMGDYAKAEPLFLQALQIRKKVLGEEHPDTASSLHNLAQLYQAVGDYAKAEPLYQQALQIREKVLGPEHRNTAESLDDLGELYVAMGEYTKAEPLIKQALQITQKVLGKEHPDTVTALNNLAQLYLAMGDYLNAEPLLQQALQIAQKVLGKEHPDTASRINSLAELYREMGEYAKAEPLLLQALRIRQKVFGDQDPITGSSVTGLALLYQDVGDYAKAEALFQQALQITKKALGMENRKTATCLNNLALLYVDMGDYAKAEPLLQQALQITQKVLGNEHPETSTSLNNLAGLYVRTRDYAKAEPLLQNALRIRQKNLGKANVNTATSLNNLAGLYMATGDYAKAEPLLQQALQITQMALGNGHPDTATSLNNLAELYRATGDYAKAEPLLEQALQIYRQIFGKEHPTTVIGLTNLALLKFELGRIDEAKTLADQESEAQLNILSKMFSFTSEQQRLAYSAIFNPYSLFTLLKGSETQLTTAILRYKGVVLDSIIEDRLLAEAAKGNDDRSRLEQLKLDQRELGQLLLRPAPKISNETGQRIEELEQEVEKVEGQLAQHIAGLGQARHALGVTLEEVQAVIPNDSALVEYLRYLQYLGKGRSESRYGAVVLRSRGSARWIPLGNAADIEALVRRYQTLVRGSPDEDELSANLKALHQAIWTPIQQILSDSTTRVIISPDGRLNFVSFATLLDSNNQFLAEKFAVQYVAAGRDLLQETKLSANKEVVLFANPDFNLMRTGTLVQEDPSAIESDERLRGTEKRGMEELSFDPLDGTQKESDALSKMFKSWRWETTDLTGAKATKAALLHLQSPYILHLATHGFFEPVGSSDREFEQLQTMNENQNVLKSKFFENPMHRSGLALAGAQATINAWRRGGVPPTENDGILTAEDVSTLNLKGTWLVTLSACNTGSGEAKAGEGVMGLRRGFIEAGAKNLLMTLWPNSDEATMQIMSNFYEAVHQTSSAPQALATVQRDWLVRLRQKEGLAKAVELAGPFILSSQGSMQPASLANP
jgi:tetratricopeptide (TPR) repeat protein